MGKRGNEEQAGAAHVFDDRILKRGALDEDQR